MNGGAASRASDADRFCDLPSGIRLCFRTDGPEDGQPLVLIAGLALDLTAWPDALVAALADAGFYVIRFDNRDAGRSTHLDTPVPSKFRQFFAISTPEDYDLDAMADDTIALLDRLGIAGVDLVGMSMGGMIAQTIAAKAPHRVLSLTSIFSTTGARKVGKTARSTLLRMARPAARTSEASAARHLAALARLGSPLFSFDPDVETRWAGEVWARGGGVAAGAGAARQVAAIQKSGDRTARLGTITAPTLVIHGDRDSMIHPTGGNATAAAIPGAHLVTVAGMRHHLATAGIPHLARLIAEHAKGVHPTGKSKTESPTTDSSPLAPA